MISRTIRRLSATALCSEIIGVAIIASTGVFGSMPTSAATTSRQVV